MQCECGSKQLVSVDLESCGDALAAMNPAGCYTTPQLEAIRTGTVTGVVVICLGCNTATLERGE